MLEVTDSNSSRHENNEALQKYFVSFDYINSTLDFLQEQLTTDTVKNISKSYQQNLSFLQNIYGEIATLNSSVQIVANDLKIDLHLILSYNQTCPEIAKSYICDHFQQI